MAIEEIKQGVSIHPNSTAPACIGLNEKMEQILDKWERKYSVYASTTAPACIGLDEQMEQEQLEYEEFQKSLSIKDEFILSLMTTSQKEKYGATSEGIKQFCKERLGK